MVITIDTENKTIIIDTPTKIEDILSFIKKLDNYKEYSIISNQPTLPYCYPQVNWQIYEVNELGNGLQPQVVY